MKKIIASLLFAVPLLTCSNGKESVLPCLETGNYYRAENGDKEFVLSVLSDQANHIQGFFYDAEEGAEAPRHSFAAEKTKNSLVFFSPQIETKKISFRKLLNEYTITPQDDPPTEFDASNLYKKPVSHVKTTPDLCYGRATGYWTSIPGYEDNPMNLFTKGYVKSFSKKELELTLDLYEPTEVKGKKPFILFIHGGAFYAGDKQELAYIDWCKHFASLGYVTASMNYRMGFRLNSDDYRNAERRAFDDACNALRFMMKHADDYGIDTDKIFLAGTSAGAMISLDIAFNRYGQTKRFGSLFPDEKENNSFQIQAVASMWGAMADLNMLGNGTSDLILFHGDADRTIHYEKGHPYWGYSIGNAIPAFSNVDLYGSAAIHRKAKELGLKSKLCLFKGEDHSFNVDKGIYPNDNHIAIRDSIASFFYLSLSDKNY